MKTKTSDLVCTPEQAIELKKLGVVQYSLFFFGPKEPILFANNDTDYFQSNSCYSKPSILKLENQYCASAFTITELRPVVKHLAVKAFELSVKCKEKYKEIDEMDLLFRPEFITDMILSALEQKVITVEQINTMLTEKNTA